MNRFPLPALMVAGLLSSMLVACGSGSSTMDNGGGPDAVTDLGTDPGIDPDVPPADPGAQDPGPADPGIPDVAQDPGADDPGANDSGPTDIPPEVEPEYPWASGCEGTGTGAIWVVSGPDATEPDPDAGQDASADAVAPVDPFLRHPFVQMSDRDTVTIVWRMAAPTALQGCVDLSWGDTVRQACGVADDNAQFEVPIDDLPPATEITYAVRVGDDAIPATTFRTMPDRPVPMKFAMFADAHNNQAQLERFSRIALAEGVDFAVSVGDQAGSGQPWEYDLYFAGLRDLAKRVNVWGVMGNHDEKNLSGYFDAFALPQGNEAQAEKGWGEGWWSRRIGNVWVGAGWIRDFYLSMPDTEWGEVGWFRGQFQTQAFQTAQWRLFFIHEPPYVTQWDSECIYDGENCLQVALVPLMAEFGLQASFHGHMHGIEYGPIEDNVFSFVAGGLTGTMDSEVCPIPEVFPSPWTRIYGIPNFLIVEAGCDALTVRYLDLDGNEVDRIVLDVDGKRVTR